uniref:Uncharacterized protein n=1 Tax=Rhizophora mucronata TaxID=61149 RepID=A0A2P2MXS0_RHIMU
MIHSRTPLNNLSFWVEWFYDMISVSSLPRNHKFKSHYLHI